MSSTHDMRHEQLLQDLITGDRTRADADVARVLAECAQCREQIAEFEGLASTLDEMDRERRDVLATPHSSTQAVLQARIRPTLERLRDEDGPQRRHAPPPGRWPWLVLAAAVVLAGFFVVRSMRPAQRPVDHTLGNEIELVSPGDVLTRDGVFECRFEATRGMSFEFHVDRGDDDSILVDVENGPLWNPTAEQRAMIPDRFRWWVKAIDISNPDLSVESEKRWSSRSP